MLNAVLATDGQALSRAENEEFIGMTTEAMWQTLIARQQGAVLLFDITMQGESATVFFAH